MYFAALMPILLFLIISQAQFRHIDSILKVCLPNRNLGKLHAVIQPESTHYSGLTDRSND